MGAVDVVPLIPIRGATSDQCVAPLPGDRRRRSPSGTACPSTFTRTRHPPKSRRNLAEIRKGEFEGFAEKMRDPRWRPGLRAGGAASHGGCGGGRSAPPLIAYNINLGTRDVAVADRIARAIRHIGGGFRYVKAMGVELADRGQVQVSINMTNFRKTPLHRVFECVRSEADRFGVPIVGSEIVGLTPADALFAAAEHYLRLEKFSSDQVLETKLLEGSE